MDYRNAQLKPGDRVILRSGGPCMTVLRHVADLKGSRPAGWEPFVEAVWFDRECRVCQSYFDPVLLVTYAEHHGHADPSSPPAAGGG